MPTLGRHNMAQGDRCRGHMSIMMALMMLVWVCAGTLLTAPATHALSWPTLSSKYEIIVDENPIDDLDDLTVADGIDGSGRKLLHGCHKKKCLKGCPKCTFPNKSTPKGHCKKKGKRHNCTRREKDSKK